MMGASPSWGKEKGKGGELRMRCSICGKEREGSLPLLFPYARIDIPVCQNSQCQFDIVKRIIKHINAVPKIGSYKVKFIRYYNVPDMYKDHIEVIDERDGKTVIILYEDGNVVVDKSRLKIIT